MLAHLLSKAMDLISFISQPGSNTKWPIPKIPGFKKFKSNTNLSKSPKIGQHTKEILKELGFRDREIINYLKKKVIG